jgi:SagB-type dehydrogenase family enzyme
MRASRSTLARFPGGRRLGAAILLAGWGAVAAFAETAPGTTEPGRTSPALTVEQRREFLRGCAGNPTASADDRRGVPAPPIQKPYPPEARRIDLVKPQAFTVGRKPLAEVIDQRRSRRDYSDASFTLEELSFLLWATQGISLLDRNAQGELVAQYRTVPSGGSRHPFETYLVIHRVEGLKPGLYRYLPVEHQLLVVREDAGLAPRLTAACYGQEFTGRAAVVFVWTAIPYRSEWHYGHLAAKLVAVEAGHVCQNLYLAAESLGAGACSVLGYQQERMDPLIGVDGRDEFVIYLAATGKPDAPSKP